MKKTFRVVLAFATLAALVGCSFANDPGIAAGVMTQASYSGEAARSLARAITYELSPADFTDSQSTLPNGSVNMKLTFVDQQVSQDGKDYILNGTVNYALALSSTSLTSVSFSAVLYGQGLALAGPDYNGSFDIDVEETMAISFDLGTGTASMSGNVTGLVGGQPVDEVISFTY